MQMLYLGKSFAGEVAVEVLKSSVNLVCWYKRKKENMA